MRPDGIVVGHPRINAAGDRRHIRHTDDTNGWFTGCRDARRVKPPPSQPSPPPPSQPSPVEGEGVIKQGRIRLPGAALSARLGGQEVTQPYSTTRSSSFHALALSLGALVALQTSGLLVAHGHLALRLFGRQAGLHERLALIALPVAGF